ncbi:hypothetical protein BSFA1_81260 (plasmid) [Burkholderia sp. SFA1]|nr:hypothetical protein BSFA1_81260 [Burkholderia sp. SFA1]
MRPNDRVVFNAAVIRRCLHDPNVVNFSGEIEKLEAGGKLAVVKIDGGGSRTIPVANLARSTRAHGIIDPTN